MGSSFTFPQRRKALFNPLLTQKYGPCILVSRGERTRKSGANVT
jgi:hypothetical protein